MLLTLLFAIAALLYAISCGFYASFLMRGAEGVALWAGRILLAAVFGHVAFLVGNGLLGGLVPAADIHQALAISSLLVSSVFLVAAKRRPRLQVLGAFITPITLLLFLGAAFRKGVGPVSEGVRSFILPVHVAVNVLGLAAFALAFAVALAYVVQARQLRLRHLGGLFQRLPSLEVLDTLGLRAVLGGFPLLTIGVISGSVWAVQNSSGAFDISASQGFGLVAWLVFASVLLLRVAAGWRGLKAAIGTIIGFFFTLTALLGYVMRDHGVG